MDGSFFEVGQNYLIRTVTMILTGRVVGLNGQEVLLADAAWIPDTGRWADALLDSAKHLEVEPYPPGRTVIVGRGALIDATPIDTLPTVQK